MPANRPSAMTYLCRFADAVSRLARQRGLLRLAAAGAATLALGGMDQAGDVQLGLSDFAQGRFAEAYQDWRAAASAGDARGALYVGVLYDSGLGVVQDEVAAMAWYRRAAERGSAAGMFNVGVLYDSGLGVPRDPEQAAAWYDRAAALGFPRAEYNLALLYESGTGVPRDPARARALFHKAAEHGLTAARIHLASLGEHLAGAATRPATDDMADFERAQQLFIRRGASEATQAAALFRKAAEHHNAYAEYDLGYCYEHGIGLPADPAQAYAWYRRAITDAADSSIRKIAETSASSLQATLNR